MKGCSECRNRQIDEYVHMLITAARQGYRVKCVNKLKRMVIDAKAECSGRYQPMRP